MSGAATHQASWRQILALAWFAALVLGASLLILGRDVLLPFILAVLVWYLIDALAGGIGRLRLFGAAPPRWLALCASLCAVAVLLFLVVALASANIAAVYDAAPLYKQNIERLGSRLSEFLGMHGRFDLAAVVREVDFVPWLQSLALGLADMAGTALLVALYVAFLLIEQHSFPAKLQAVFPDPEARRRAAALLGEVQRRIEAYIWIKTLMSLLTGLASYAVLLLVGVDYAAFWGLLIFLLNYIPAVGSLIAILFPALLALVQFDSLLPGAMALLGCGLVQFLVGSVLEPRIAGNRLNISPLVVIVSLALWGAIWGVAGMFLSMPITVMLTIVLAHFPATRPIAALLSSRGQLDIPDPSQKGG